jgi:hypothetical protein
VITAAIAKTASEDVIGGACLAWFAGK